MSTRTIPRLETFGQGRAFTWILALALLAAAAGLRLTDLEHNPPGLWQDEASTGLDAYLLWTTGKDRAGVDYPIISRSFGDYPLAGYRYLAAPIVGIFGLTAGHERLPAAIFGTWLVLVTFWLVRQRVGRGAGLAAMLSAAFAPNWLHFSRYGSEAILLPAALATGLALVDLGRRGGRYRAAIWAGAVALAASAYTYHAVKLFLPIWMAGFLVLQWPLVTALWREGARGRVHLFGPAVLFALLVLPSMHAAISAGGMARGQTVLAWYRFEGLQLARTMASNYLSYFDPGMLFVRGGPAAAQSIPGLGRWQFVELPFMIVGLASLFRDPRRRRFGGFVLFWFLIGPLPGGVTYETQNMGRAIAWVPAPQIIAGWGLWVAARALRRALVEGPAVRRALAGLAAALTVGGWAATAYAVYWCTLVNYPQVAERDFQYEITRALLCAKDQREPGERIVVDSRFQMAQIFAEFHYAGEARNTWSLGTRQKVRPGEIYAFPAVGDPPEGTERCRITHAPSGQVLAYVYGPPPGAILKRAPGAPELKLNRPTPEIGQPPVRLNIPRVKTGTPTRLPQPPGRDEIRDL